MSPRHTLAAALALGLGCDPGRGALETGSFTEEIDGRSLHYEIHGKGPVLMTVPNSWGLSLEGLRALYRPLERQLTMVYFDPRGMGGSGPDRDASDRGPAAVREDFDALRRHLGLERVAAIGWSNGATNLVFLASEHPEAFEAAIFLHGNASFTEEDQRRLSERYGELFREFGRFGREMRTSELTAEERNARVKAFDVGVWFPYMFHDRERAREALARAFREAEFSWEHFLATNEEWATLDATDRLRAIQARTLVIAGRHDMMPPERSKEIADGVSGESEFVVFENSGHFAPLEETEKFVETVTDFLGAE